MSQAHRISDPAVIKRYATAGKAVFTLVSERTGTRFTYQIQVKKDSEGAPTDFFFVSVLTGPQNTSDYTYLGCVRGGRYLADRKLRIGADAPSRRAFEWFWARLDRGADLAECECWHEGACGRCGRALTVPESIESGLGPVCAGKAA